MKTTQYVLPALAAVVLALTAFSVQATPTTSYYVYDESGHVIGEYDANGNPVQEHIYLGDRPVAVVQDGNAATLDYVTTNQLNTPRAVTDSSQTVEWSWSSDPFGNGQPTGSLTYNLRFPGQYYDAETGHNYNYERDYDSTTGRYVESDPIGLKGGLNTYDYVGNDPINALDDLGLYKVYGNWCGPDWTGGYTKEWNQMTPYEQQHAAPPIGSLDLACENHDKCYANCRSTFPCNPADRSACFKNCDKALRNSAFGIYAAWMAYIIISHNASLAGLEEMFASIAITDAMSRPGTRDPGPNAPNCPHCGVGGK